MVRAKKRLPISSSSLPIPSEFQRRRIDSLLVANCLSDERFLSITADVCLRCFVAWAMESFTESALMFVATNVINLNESSAAVSRD